MDIKLFDSELKVMDVLWKEGDTPAREIARVLSEEQIKKLKQIVGDLE